jgi:hypothetical protein
MIELEFRNVDFSLEARERINNKLNSHGVPEPRIKPTTHWHHSQYYYERRAYYMQAKKERSTCTIPIRAQSKALPKSRQKKTS